MPRGSCETPYQEHLALCPSSPSSFEAFEIDRHHPAALTGKGLRDGAADARAGGGNQCDLIGKAQREFRIPSKIARATETEQPTGRFGAPPAVRRCRVGFLNLTFSELGRCAAA